MAQMEIEVILTRQLASYLATPIFVVDKDGRLIFYNEPAESILGRRFEETAEMSGAEVIAAFSPMDSRGKKIDDAKIPLRIALAERRPAFLCFWIRGLDGVKRQIDVTAFPLIGQANALLGAVALFWEVQE